MYFYHKSHCSTKTTESNGSVFSSLAPANGYAQKNCTERFSALKTLPLRASRVFRVRHSSESGYHQPRLGTQAFLYRSAKSHHLALFDRAFDWGGVQRFSAFSHVVSTEKERHLSDQESTEIWICQRKMWSYMNDPQTYWKTVRPVPTGYDRCGAKKNSCEVGVANFILESWLKTSAYEIRTFQYGGGTDFAFMWLCVLFITGSGGYLLGVLFPFYLPCVSFAFIKVKVQSVKNYRVS